MRDVGPLLLLSLVALTASLAAGQGAPISGWLDSTGPSTIQGTGAVELAAMQATSAQVGPSDGYTLWCETGTLVLWNYPVQELRVMRDGEPEVRDVRGLPPEQVAIQAVGTAPILVAASGSAYDAWLFDEVQLPDLVQGNGFEALGPQGRPFTSFSNPLYHVTEVDGVVLRPPGSSIWVALDSTDAMEFSGPFQAAVFGHELEQDGNDRLRDWPVGRVLNESQTMIDPATGSGRIVWDTWIVHVECGEARVAFGESPPVQFLASRLAGWIEGDFVWRGVESHADVAGSNFDETNHILQAFGNLSFDADLKDQHVHWQFVGTVDALVADTAPVPLPPAAVAGGLAAFLVLVAAFWESIRGLLTFVLGRTTPVLVKADLFGNQTRRTILRVLRERPVATVGDLMKATAKSRASVRYNLRILTAHGVLQTHNSRRLPKLQVYSLNSDSLRVSLADGEAVDSNADQRPSATKAGGLVLAEALAVVYSNSIREEIFTFLEHHPGRSRDEIADHLFAILGRRVPSSTLHDHLDLLLQSGAIRRIDPGPPGKLASSFTIRAVQDAQLQRFLEASGLLVQLQHAVGSLGSTRTGAHRDAKALRHLEAMGLVQRLPDGDIMVPASMQTRLEPLLGGITNAA